MSFDILVAVSGSLRLVHEIAGAALVDGAFVALGPHVVDKTTLSCKGLLALLAAEVVESLQMHLQLRHAAEAVSAKLTGWPVALVGHVQNHLFVQEELRSASIALVKRAVDDSLRSISGGHCDRVVELVQSRWSRRLDTRRIGCGWAVWRLQLPVSDDLRRRGRGKKSGAGEEGKGGYIGKRIFVYAAEKNMICSIMDGANGSFNPDSWREYRRGSWMAITCISDSQETQHIRYYCHITRYIWASLPLMRYR